MRLWVWSVVTLAALFSSAIALLRAQPDTTSALLDVFQPPADCPAPCWLGIRPGVTTGDDALALLADHAWFSEIEPWGRVSTVLWWSGAQPDVIDAAHPAVMTIENGIVQRISVPTTIPFGDLWLVYGAPERGGFVCIARAWRNGAVHFATYPRAGFSISLQDGMPAHCAPNVERSRCPIALPELWRATSDVILGPVYVQLEEYDAMRSQTPPYCVWS